MKCKCGHILGYHAEDLKSCSYRFYVAPELTDEWLPCLCANYVVSDTLRIPA